MFLREKKIERLFLLEFALKSYWTEGGVKGGTEICQNPFFVRIVFWQWGNLEEKLLLEVSCERKALGGFALLETSGIRFLKSGNSVLVTFRDILYRYQKLDREESAMCILLDDVSRLLNR